MKKLIAKTAIVLLTVTASVTYAQAIEGINFSDNDWELACDNTGTCRAAGYSNFGISVLFSRPAGANQAISGELSVVNYDERNPPTLFQLWVDEKDYGRIELTSSATPLSATQVQAVLDTAKNNLPMLFVYQNSAEVTPPNQYDDIFPNQGMRAVFSKMDEFQKRVDTVGAIIQKGSKPETRVLQPQPVPVLTIPTVLEKEDDKLTQYYMSQKEKLIALTQADFSSECRLEFAQGEEPELDIYPLNAQYALVARLCWRAAYNYGVAFWLTDTSLNSAELITSLANYYEGGQLFSSQKGRGYGDCWYMQIHSWDGSLFTLTRKSSTGMCRGQAGGFWDLPTVVYEVVNAH